MARMDSIQKKNLKNFIQSTSPKWIAFGIEGTKSSKSEMLEGVAGVLDWIVHGQVSRLLANDLVENNQFCLVPGDEIRNRPNILFYRFNSDPDSKKFTDHLKKLQIKDIALADSTFPEDFLRKVKQNLKKESIGCNRLEQDLA